MHPTFEPCTTKPNVEIQRRDMEKFLPRWMHICMYGGTMKIQKRVVKDDGNINMTPVLVE